MNYTDEEIQNHLYKQALENEHTDELERIIKDYASYERPDVYMLAEILYQLRLDAKQHQLKQKRK